MENQTPESMKKEVYKRNLPHIQPIGATFFVTYNLFGSLPAPLLEKWKEEYEMQKAQIQAKISDAKKGQIGSGLI